MEEKNWNLKWNLTRITRQSPVHTTIKRSFVHLGTDAISFIRKWGSAIVTSYKCHLIHKQSWSRNLNKIKHKISWKVALLGNFSQFEESLMKEKETLLRCFPNKMQRLIRFIGSRYSKTLTLIHILIDKEFY